MTMHEQMAATMERCVQDIRAHPGRGARHRQGRACALADDRAAQPEGLDGPEEGRRSRRSKATGAHTRCRSPTCATIPQNLKLLEEWLRSYRPEELFDDERAARSRNCKALAPQGTRRMSANPHANGGQLRKAAAAAGFPRLCGRGREPRHDRSREHADARRVPARRAAAQPRQLPRVRPDETTSNKLEAVYEASKKTWLADYLPVDADGGELSPDGRVMEMLSEHTLEGWLEGYLLTGRHGFFSTYEAFVHVIDSMFNQHAKWLDICSELPWRAPVSSLNLLITSTVWRQDHNGFTHQDPGFLDVVVNKSPDGHAHLPAAGLELPAGGGRPLPAQHRLRQRDRHRQAEAPAVPRHGRRDQPLHQGHRNLGLGQHRRRAPSRTS